MKYEVGKLLLYICCWCRTPEWGQPRSHCAAVPGESKAAPAPSSPLRDFGY